MDIVWMGALLALWAVVAAMVIGLNRLDAPKPSNKAPGAADGAAS
ncbi:hypothetical protein ACCC97_04515 [Variovorax sp. Varisp85]|jgi:hypothetical protein|nr:hypothetical protein [Variovorax sp. CF313]EJL69379.1 hypothetical protein PMI12_05156 [Variovorax sp. CF313]